MSPRPAAAIPEALLRAHVSAALAEDHAAEDVTSRWSLPPGLRGDAVVLAGGDGVLAGSMAAELSFRLISPAVQVTRRLRDGARLASGARVLRARGPAAAILAAERTALNYLMRLSGVATLTARFVEVLRGTGVRLLDTRKTTPLMRLLEKDAVVAGGGYNHRLGLHDAVLIKENHVQAAGGLRRAVERVLAGLERTRHPTRWVEVEAQSLDQVREARDLPVHRILLDNFSPADARRAVRLLRQTRPARSLEIEISGGIHLGNIRLFALSGVDYISVGALTHSAPAVPFSLDWKQ